MTFWKTVGAYLTGWVIAQSTFRKLWELHYSDYLAEQREQQVRELAEAVVDQMGRIYPYKDGDTTVIGPECFASEDKSVISWGAVNYYRDYHGDPT